MLQAVADVHDLHFVEFTGLLFTVAGDEGHGAAVGDEGGGGGDLLRWNWGKFSRVLCSRL